VLISMSFAAVPAVAVQVPFRHVSVYQSPFGYDALATAIQLIHFNGDAIYDLTIDGWCNACMHAYPSR
jgi:hypothetical protein